MIEEIKVPFPGSDHGEKRKNEIVIDPSVDVDTDIVREKEEVLESPTQPPTKEKEYPPLTTTRDDNIVSINFSTHHIVYVLPIVRIP
jgi:hypothetical protein